MIREKQVGELIASVRNVKLMSSWILLNQIQVVCVPGGSRVLTTSLGHTKLHSGVRCLAKKPGQNESWNKSQNHLASM